MGNSGLRRKSFLFQVLLFVTVFVLYLLFLHIESERLTFKSVIKSQVFLSERALSRPSSCEVTLSSSVKSVKTILFWTTFWGSPDIFAIKGKELFTDCPISNCIPSVSLADLNTASAVMFYPSDINLVSLPPPPRRADQYFVFYFMESAGSLELVPTYPNWHLLRNFFNLTMTYRHDSDIFFREYFNSYHTHTYQPRNRTKNILWLVSHCKTFSFREIYAEELSKYTQVDVFGKCGNSTDNLRSDFQKDYMFYLAFENTICKDYLTEKLMFALNHDLIPIVYGGADYNMLLPPGSFINVEDFETPENLADFVKNVSHNSSLYNTFHTWKTVEWNFPIVTSKAGSSWCQLCELVNRPPEQRLRKVYPDIAKWWVTDQCRSSRVIENLSSLQTTTKPTHKATYEFNFSHGRGMCAGVHRELTAIISVHSATTNFVNRDMIRKSWGSPERTRDFKFLLFFIMGETSSEVDQKKINEESKLNGDIVQFNMLDSYKNLTYKSLAELFFVNKDCQENKFRYFFKIDDDMFVHLEAVAKFADQYMISKHLIGRTIFCEHVIDDGIVYHSPENKWYITVEEWSEPTFPRYCPGSMNVFTKDLIPLILTTAKTVKFLWIDDVFVTGVVARAIGNVTHVILPRAKYPLVTHTFQNMTAMSFIYWNLKNESITEERPIETGL